MTAPELSDRDREAVREAWIRHSPHATIHTSVEVAAQFRDAIYAVYLAGLLAGRERQWIPVSERLPDDGHYHVFMSKFPNEVPQADFRRGRWWSLDADPLSLESFGITHWMPLPNPPANRIEGRVDEGKDDGPNT